MKITGISNFKGFTCLLLAVLISVTSAGAAQLQKTFTWKYPLKAETRVILNNYDCDMIIHIWDKNEAEYHLTIDATGRNPDDETRLTDYLTSYNFSNSASSVNFHNSFWKNRRTIMGITTLDIEGEKNIVLVEFTMKGELWIPASNPLELNSKYSKINLDDFRGKLSLDLYNGDLFAGNLMTNSEIKAKYANLQFNDIKDINADLYNCDFEAESTGKITILTKYSKFNARNSGNLDINSYNDKFAFEKTGDIIFRAKYSDLTTAITGTADIECYDGVIVLGDARDIKVNSKYADFKLKSAGNLRITNSYDDKFRVEKLTSLLINESKYSIYNADELSMSLTESDGYDDNFTISRIGDGFNGIDITGKYVDISLGIPVSADFRLKTAIKYPTLDIDETLFKTRLKIMEHSELQYDGVRGVEKDDMPVVEVNGYDISLKIINLK